MSRFSSRAWSYTRCGPISQVLSYETVEVVAKTDEVVVEVLQSPLHRVDAAIVNGSVLGRRRLQLPAFPRVGGSEGVGVVAAANPSSPVKEGDTVWVAPLNGLWATRVAVPAVMVHKIDPKTVSLAVNASNYLTAHRLITGFAPLQRGQTIVQNGGSSVTSLAVTALAKLLGLRVVTASTPGERFDAAKQRHVEYGGEVFEYNGKGAREMRQVLDSSEGAALYLNAVGGRHFDTFLGLLGRYGHAVSYGAQGGVGLMVSGSNFIFNEVTMEGFFLPSYLASLTYEERQTQLEMVLQQLSSIGFKYPTTVATSLEDMPKVWDKCFVQGGTKGVVVVKK
uniref:enoyl-[acyl-carrier-protein] reductase n=1 Tax=Trypanosoma congolense (strain IL3000) TaxID=1068625 RepID=G0UQX9_TRYCI|nr:putative oxidoreductase [Trypanosoma congolense IL3000]